LGTLQKPYQNQNKYFGNSAETIPELKQIFCELCRNHIRIKTKILGTLQKPYQNQNKSFWNSAEAISESKLRF
jgi:hypothetical protein